MKLKNTDRALDIAKTLFGMVDEMDSTDFGVQRDSAQGIFNKEPEEVIDNKDTQGK